MEAPQNVLDRVRRGRTRMRKSAAKRNECLSFWRGNHYAYVDDKDQLRFLPTATSIGGGGKEPWRVRQTRNLLTPIVRKEVSAATQRVPSYDVAPSSSDPEDISAARVASQVALYLYEAADVRRAMVDLVTYAVVADEGFAWPYWDTNQGPFIDGTGTRLGEVAIRVYGRNEVIWEPGLRFHESPWHAVEQARDVNEVQALPGYIGPKKLEPDADVGEGPTHEKKRQAENLVLVTDFLERPCAQYPKGKWRTLAAGQEILEARDYPTAGVKGMEDYPVLHKLSYIIDPDSDTDQGLVRHLLDAVRTVDDCTNKQVELKNHALVPQLLAPKGSLRTQPTSEPGQVIYYEPTGGQVPQWRPAPDAGLLDSLQKIKAEAREDLQYISSQNDLPGGDVSGDALQVRIENDQSTRQEFFANVAGVHSSVMRHMLALTQMHYTEPRLVQINGRFGPDRIEDFKGASLRNQIDVRVFPGSIEPRTRQSIEKKVMTLYQLQLISKEQALAGLNGGVGERLVDSYELDVGRANLMIQKLRQGVEVVMAEPDYFDSITGQEVPGYMPRRNDNERVWKAVWSDFLKLPEFDRLNAEQKEVAYQIYDGLEMLEMQKAAQAAQAQAAQAEQLGASNAAKPQAPPPMPSLPAAIG